MDIRKQILKDIIKPQKREQRIEIKERYIPSGILDKWLKDTPSSSVTPEYLLKISRIPPLIFSIERRGIIKIIVN